MDLPPRAVVGEAVHDFGIVRRGTTVRHTFTLSNEGTSRLVIGRAETTDETFADEPPAVLDQLRETVCPSVRSFAGETVGQLRPALELRRAEVD